jgi:hypothetical protein
LATATPAIDIFVVVSLPTWPTTNTGQIRCLFMQPIRFELGVKISDNLLSLADEVIE